MIKLLIFIFLPGICLSQSFAPAAGQVGSTAIHKDSTIIEAWATGVTVQRGYFEIAYPQSGTVTFGDDSNALGPAEGTSTDVVSLGDSGVAILTFERPIINEIGPDFVVFENGFADNYLELAFVEVSSDGLNYVRFPAVSETPTDNQVGPFDYSDCRYVHNLAGKYRQGFGTPFDLEDLADSANIDLNNITHIKLIDVIGTIDDQYASYDSQGNKINDLYPTGFESGGFDLDAVGVIHQKPLTINEQEMKISIYPNPTSGQVEVTGTSIHEIKLYSTEGKLLYSTNEKSFSIASFPTGTYLLQVKGEQFTNAQKIIKY